METKQILAVIEGLGLLAAGVAAYTGDTMVGALGLGVAGLLRLVDEFM